MKYLSLSAICIVAFIFFLTGCVSPKKLGTNKLAEPSKYSSLKSGVSTKKDVYISFGQPHDVEYGNEDISSWRYFYVDQSLSVGSYIPFLRLITGGIDSKTRIMTMNFDNKGLFISSESRDLSKTVNKWTIISNEKDAPLKDKKYKRVEDEMKQLNLSFDENYAKSMSAVELFAD